MRKPYSSHPSLLALRREGQWKLKSVWIPLREASWEMEREEGGGFGVREKDVRDGEKKEREREKRGWNRPRERELNRDLGHES